MNILNMGEEEKTKKEQNMSFREAFEMAKDITKAQYSDMEEEGLENAALVLLVEFALKNFQLKDKEIVNVVVRYTVYAYRLGKEIG